MPGIHNLAWTLAWVISGRADETLLDTFELERRHVGIAAAAQSVANLEGLFEVVAALGLTRRGVSQLPQWLAGAIRCRCADIGLTKGSDGWMTLTRR